MKEGEVAVNGNVELLEETYWRLREILENVSCANLTTAQLKDVLGMLDESQSNLREKDATQIEEMIRRMREFLSTIEHS
jgi:hypothetical protein